MTKIPANRDCGIAMSTWMTSQRMLLASLLFVALIANAQTNLLKNPGFEDQPTGTENPPSWVTVVDSKGKPQITDKEMHGGQKGLVIPAGTAVEQKVDSVREGAYLARGWVKSEADQSVTLLLRNPDQPWLTYACAEIRLPRGQWTQIETFCAVDVAGPLSLALGGMSKEFHLYHGTLQDMAAPITVDDFELIRYEAKFPADLARTVAWDRADDSTTSLAWPPTDKALAPDTSEYAFAGTPLIQGGHLAGSFRKRDGGLVVYALNAGEARQRCVLTPSPALSGAKFSLVHDKSRTGLRVQSSTGNTSYTAWFNDSGLMRIETKQVPEFHLVDCRLRVALLPSFAGTDLSYTPEQIGNGKACNIPSTQWLVGLVDGNNSMLVAAWETNSQSVSLGSGGSGENGLINSITIGTQGTGFSLSFVEHPNLWHREALKEDWLGEYTPISWQRPFPARWMGQLSVTSGRKSSFRDPGINYSFPFANAKTRMWGVWFEDWNHYPFFFDGAQTVFHFEKTFIPQGEALVYFLEPAAADLLSPCEIVEQALGREKAMALFDFGANQLRKLKYSTPDLFMFDRPVCATTTRLSKIRQFEKPTVGAELATHLYEFIREIRGRVDQYRDFFDEAKAYLEAQGKTNPDLQPYARQLEGMLAEARAQAEEIYTTSLESVKAKTDKMKALLQEGQGDGFNCGNLDVRDTAGSQDDLCRRYNRFVIKIAQTAALKCGDSPEKALIATHLWEMSRQVLRRPTRWEPRRTLYFFEP